jgi:hypothetical protein
MSGFLGQRTSAFEGLQWVQVLVLLDVLRECTLRTERHIEKRFRERAVRFVETLAFLEHIGLVEKRDGNILFQNELNELCSENLFLLVLEHILQSRTRYKSEILRYLSKFSISGGEVSYRSNPRTRSLESAVRNFLMEMGVVTYNRQEDRYILRPEHVALYVHARQDALHYTPGRVSSAAEDHRELGFLAERAVVALEIERLGSLFSNRVDHVALRNAAAGYDILSVTATTITDTTPRYIEVKAVSPQSFRFYWTRNEVQVARLLGSLYYLYLLPVHATGEFLIDQLVMICDPYTAVLSNEDVWAIETDVLLCRLKHTGLYVSVS